MMLIATTAASALFASILSAGPAAAPAASSSAIPPMIINVTTDAAELSPALVKRILAETDAIWRSSGVTFVWRRAARVVVPYARASETGPYVPNTLRLTIGENRGVARDARTPLGWILFDDLAEPQQEIYLSHANAVTMMDQARGVIGIVAQMPIAQRETLLARAMGRALAHELGHYLLASKLHTQRGLMKATLTAVELFMPDQGPFRIDQAQRGAVTARLRGDPLVASR
jgi:hypothetical protein